MLTVIDKQIRTLLWQRVTMNYEYKWPANWEWEQIQYNSNNNNSEPTKKQLYHISIGNPITRTRPMNFYLFFSLPTEYSWKEREGVDSKRATGWWEEKNENRKSFLSLFIHFLCPISVAIDHIHANHKCFTSGRNLRFVAFLCERAHAHPST